MDEEELLNELQNLLLFNCPNCGAVMEVGKGCPECSHEDDAIYDCRCGHCIAERANWNLRQLPLEEESSNLKVRIAE